MLTQTGGDKIALVTGASRGLGASLAKKLVQRGFILVTMARTVGGLEELDDQIRDIGGKSFLCPLDLTKDKEVQTACQNIYRKWGQIDLWFHTAIRAAPLTLTHQIEQKVLEQSMAVNIRATCHLISCIHPLLKKSGRAVFFDDPRLGKKFMGIYGSTKRAQIELAKTWRQETTNLGPRVIIYKPAEMYTKTTLTFYPGVREMDISTPDEEAEKLVKTLKF